MNIIQACQDERLLRPFFGKEYSSFASWRWVLRAIYGIELGPKGRNFIRDVTGRDPDKLNPDGFMQTIALTGRRSGKSKGLAAVAGAWEAALAGNEEKLSPGEIGMVAVISPTKHQSNIVKSYIAGIFNSTPALRNEIARETQTGFELRSGIHIGILAGDWRTVRGFTLLAAIVDELCFFGVDIEASRVRSDSELIAALRPGLATTGGRLIGISSVYAKRGWAYEQWRRHFANDTSSSQDTLVVHATSKKMNETLDQRIIDAALRDDYARASAEFLSIWRNDVGLLVPRELLETLVVRGRDELSPQPGVKYFGFCDVSGGRSDDATLAISHRVGRKVIIDCVRRWPAPFDPYEIIGSMANELRRWRLSRVTGDNYSAEFTASAFRSRGIGYTKSDKSKSELYLELIGRLCSGEIELLDSSILIDQLASLERRTRVGGRDSVDHPPGGKDDVANSVAGVCELAVTRRIVCGAFGRTSKAFEENPYE